MFVHNELTEDLYIKLLPPFLDLLSLMRLKHSFDRARADKRVRYMSAK